MNEIPELENQDEERELWSEHDSTELGDWSKAKRGVFPNLRRPRADNHTLTSVSLVVRLTDRIQQKASLRSRSDSNPVVAAKIVRGMGSAKTKTTIPLTFRYGRDTLSS